MKVFTLLIFFLSINLIAQIKLPKQFRSTYEGNEFVIGFFQNEIFYADEPVDQKILISSRYNTSATLTYPDNKQEVYKISPNNSKSIKIPFSLMIIESGQEVRKTISIKSDRNIVVTGYSSQYMSSDMFIAIPTSRWGYEYQAITMGVDHYMTTDAPSNNTELAKPRLGQFLMIANEDNTVIKFTPRKETKNHPANQEVMIFLDKGESYLVQSAETQTKTANDLSGSVIRSNRKIGVISGHMRSAVPPKIDDRFSDSKDHLVEMLNPSEYFGKEYVTAPFGQGIKSLYVVTTLEDRAEIDILTNDGVEKVTLGFPGAVKYVRVDGAAKWTSDNKFQLGQFMARYGEEDEDCNEFYDPAFVIIQPADYFNNNLNFLTVGYNESNYYHTFRETSCGEDHKNRQYISHHAILIAKDEARYSTTVDGVNYAVSNFEGTIPGTDYYYGYIDLEPGDHIIESKTGGFQGILYGRGFFDSYAYSLGSSILSNEIEDSVELDVTFVADCDSYVLNIYDNDEFKSGIQFVDINNDSYNYEILELNIKESNGIVRLKQKDKRKDSKVVVDYFDNAGNGAQVTNFFKGINPIAYDVDLGQIYYDPNKVFYFDLKNEGNNEIEILNISFDSNRFFLADPFQVFKIDANETKKIGFMIRNQDISNIPLSNFVYVESECDVIDTAEIKLDIVQYGLQGLGYDFEDVLLGDNECGLISFKNSDEDAITLTNLEFEQTHITLDTTGIFPITLHKDESIEIITCTNPNTRDNVVLNVTAKAYGLLGVMGNNDTIYLSETVQVRENIVGAIFEDIYYDFGVCYKDLNYKVDLNLKNIGNHIGEPIFLDTLMFEGREMSSKNMITALNTLSNSKINPSQILSFEYYFEPTEIGRYSNRFRFSYLEGVIERNVNLFIDGLVLSSDIKTNNLCFDTIYTFEEDEKQLTLLEYNGDVDRNIYVIRPEKLYYSNIGDNTLNEINLIENPFELNNLDYNSIIKDGEIINSDIRFKPVKNGYYELQILCVVNSLEVSKNFDSLYVSVCGIAVDPIYPNVDMSLDINDIWACDTTDGNITISNIGETDVLIHNLTTESKYFSNLILDNINLPYFLLQDESLTIPVNIFRKKDEIDTLKVFAEITNEKLEFSSTFIKRDEIIPKYEQLILPDLNFEYNIGDTSIVNIYGDIPYDIDIPTQLTIELEVDYKVLWLVSENVELILTNSIGENKVIKTSIRKNFNKIIFYLPFFEFDLEGEVRWSLDIKFLTMLSNKFDSEIKISTFYNDCFSENSKIYPVILDEVCVQGYRTIEYFDKGEINSNLNYLNNELKIDFRIPVSSDISIYLVDMLGKKLDLYKKKFVNKGNYFLNYDLNLLPNGNYFLFVETKYLQERKKIIIYK